MPQHIQTENLEQLRANLLQQKEGTAYQNQYWKLQAEKADAAKEHEILKMKVTEIGIEKAAIEKPKLQKLVEIEIENATLDKKRSEKLMEIEIQKQAQLAEIEIQKQKAIAEMELEMKRKQLGLRK